MAETSITDRVRQLSAQATGLCYHCHKCRAGCPAASAMDYGPDGILRLLEFQRVEHILSSRDIWLCLGCKMCGAHCPNGIDVGEVAIALRQIAAEQGYRREDCEQLREMLAQRLIEGDELEVDERLCIGVQRLNQLSESVSTAHNVSGENNDGRTIWSENLARVPEGLTGRRGAEIVYFVGCVGAFFPRSYRVPQSMTRILEAAEADYTTLGGQEWCCGYPLLALGETEQARRLARHNIDRVKDLGATRIVSTCPSCYHMWKAIYPKLVEDETDVQVLHATELVAEWIAEERVPLGALPLRVTYHDPCDLGRKGEVYDAPRQVLRSIPGLSLVEMSSSGQISECCGGGGNLETFDPEVVSDVALRRIDRANEVKAQVLISACQQCERTLMNAVRRHPKARRARMRVMDVAELVCQAMDKASAQEGQ